MFSDRFSSTSVFKNKNNPLIPGSTTNIIAAYRCMKILFRSSLVLLSVLNTTTEA